MNAYTGLPAQIPLQGANNFRDLGGYPLADGSTFKTGCVFRSDHLANLTDADQHTLKELGIKVVVDFRRGSEREENLDNISDPAIRQIWLPIDADAADIKSLRQQMEQGQLSSKKAYQYLIDANKEFIRDFDAPFREFVHLLLDQDNYPILFHCTAGKDRAGFAAALTLLLAGASIETVFHDYLATNDCTANYVNGIVDGLADVPDLKVDPEAVRILMQVQPVFLQSALDTITEDYGDLPRYFEQALQLSADKRATIKQWLSVPA